MIRASTRANNEFWAANTPLTDYAAPREHPQPSDKWILPPDPFLKINVDGAFKDGRNEAGIGVI